MLRQVRVRLRPPPRTLSNRDISPRLSKSPQLAGSDVGIAVSAETNSGLDGILAELSLALNSGCRATETIFCRDAVRMCGYRLSLLKNPFGLEMGSQLTIVHRANGKWPGLSLRQHV